MGVRRVPRHSTEFKLQRLEAHLAGEGSAKGLAASPCGRALPADRLSATWLSLNNCRISNPAS